MSDLETQLSDQLDSYIAAFNARDFLTAASHYHEPAVAISSSAGVTILPERVDLAGFLSNTVARAGHRWIRPLRVDGTEEGGCAG